ncbi:MAG: arsenosugar biosynthesis radical SAM (seleno)protein ArsS [Planctomycetota bacterium]|jgi:radical SAM/Cys-rich protein
MNEFERRVREVTGADLASHAIHTVQVNLGLRCNQCCAHCHLNASPARDEQMDRPTMEKVIELARAVGAEVMDLTGGAPELNRDFRRFVDAVVSEGISVQSRTNLSVLLEPGLGDLIPFLAERKVALVASMPCYLHENVCAQRGEGVYDKSIEAIRRLNEGGYGREGGLPLNLVYNPGGPVLPPDQNGLEADYRRELGDRFGLEFTKLLTITNMPIGRFRSVLEETNRIDEYSRVLRAAFNPETLENLMCRSQISVGWDGRLFDCDFNLALGWPVDHGAPDHVDQFDVQKLTRRRIVTEEHCFGCTAGAGSSCAGALTKG